MSNSLSQRNYLLDVLKCLACFSVVCLHFPTTTYTKEITNLQCIFGRMGVPIFFLISGYMVSKKDETLRRRWYISKASKMIMDIVVFSAILTVLYGILDSIYYGEFFHSVKYELTPKRIRYLLFFSKPLAFNYLWYLIAYAECLLIYWILSSSKYYERIFMVLTPILTIFYFVFGRYSKLILGKVFDANVASSWIFAAVPLFTLGLTMDKIRDRIHLSNTNIIILMIVAMLLSYAEGSWFLTTNYNVGRNNFVFNNVASFWIVYLCTNGNIKSVDKNNWMAIIGNRYSLYIYVYQFFVTNVFQRLFTVRVMKPFIGLYKYTRPFAVFMGALFLGYVSTKILLLFVKIKNRVRKL